MGIIQNPYHNKIVNNVILLDSLPILHELEGLEISDKLSYTENENGLLAEGFDTKDPYKSEYSFTFRILYAIQKFKKKAKFTNQENTLFQLYLNYGEVEQTIKPITKQVKIDPRNNKPIEVEIMIHDDCRPVDFLYTIHSFIVDAFVKNTRFTQNIYYELVGPLIKKFLVYLLDNNVCSEYEDDIKESVKLCDQVSIELPMSKELGSSLPDKINKSFSLLYEGNWSAMIDINPKSSGAYLENEAYLEKTMGFSLNNAKLITNYESREHLKIEKRLLLIMSIDSIDREAGKLFLKEKCEGYEPLEFYIQIDKITLKYCLENILLDGSFIKLSDGTWYLDQLFYISPPFAHMNNPN